MSTRATGPFPQSDPVCKLPSYLIKTLFHIILPSVLKYSKWSFPIKTLQALCFSPSCAICPAHYILLVLITHIIFGDEYK